MTIEPQTTSWPLTNQHGYELAMLTFDNGDLNQPFVWAESDIELRDLDALVPVSLPDGEMYFVRASQVALYTAPIGEHDHPADLGEFELWLPDCAYCDIALNDDPDLLYPSAAHFGPSSQICRVHPLEDRPRPHQAKYRAWNIHTGTTFVHDPRHLSSARLRSREREIARLGVVDQAGALGAQAPIAELSPERQLVALRTAKLAVENAAADLSRLAGEVIAAAIRAMIPDAAALHVDLGPWCEFGGPALLDTVFVESGVPIWRDHREGVAAPHGQPDEAWNVCRAFVEDVVNLVLEVANPATAGWPHNKLLVFGDRLYRIVLPPDPALDPDALPDPEKHPDAHYQALVNRAIRNQQADIAPFLTTECPECGPTTGYFPHDSTDPDADPNGTGYVAISCEGEWLINPSLLGLDYPNWHDWTTNRE